MKVIVDKRPFIKTAVEKGQFMEISRINQTTGKLYKVLIDKQIYHDFIRSQRSKEQLSRANLTRTELNFILKNVLLGEIR